MTVMNEGFCFGVAEQNLSEWKAVTLRANGTAKALANTLTVAEDKKKSPRTEARGLFRK